MRITKELLDAEIASLERQRAQHEAHLLKIDGAVSVLRQLIPVLDKPESEECQPETL